MREICRHVAFAAVSIIAILASKFACRALTGIPKIDGIEFFLENLNIVLLCQQHTRPQRAEPTILHETTIAGKERGQARIAHRTFIHYGHSMSARSITVTNDAIITYMFE